MHDRQNDNPLEQTGAFPHTLLPHEGAAAHARGVDGWPLSYITTSHLPATPRANNRHVLDKSSIFRTTVR
jgi:hypothetical protein